MRILVVLPYGPTSTRVRSRMLLRELAGRHELTLIGLAWNDDDREAFATWPDPEISTRVVEHGARNWARAVIGNPRLPLQRVVSTSAALAGVVRQTIAAADAAGRPFDAAHVEHLRGAAAADLPAGLGVWTVLDAVDCIAELARLTRLHHTGATTRLLARLEEGPTRRYEARLVAAADRVAVVAERDRLALARSGNPERITIVPNGVDSLARPAPLTDEPVVIFTGKLSYHANQAAARRLLDRIWPRVRASRPDAQLVIAGADAPRWLLARDGSDGVLVRNRPPEMTPLIARARVAVAPMIYSVGIQNKVLEAMACGIPVVATTTATAGLLPASAGALLRADEDEHLAAQVTRLLGDDALARALGLAGHAYATRCHSWAAASRQFESLYAASSAAARAA